MIPDSIRNKRGVISYAQMSDEGFWLKRSLVDWRSEQLNKYSCSDIRLAVWLMDNSRDDLKCSTCGCDMPFERRGREFCSVLCARRNAEWRKQVSVKNTENSSIRSEKRRATNIARYGVACSLQDEGVKQKAANTVMDKYGVSNVSKNEGVKQKIKRTNEARYGVGYTQQNVDVRRKSINALQAKYGDVQYPFQSKAIQDKAKQTNIVRYDTEYAASSPTVRSKIRDTNVVRYGGASPFCSDAVREKAGTTIEQRYGVRYNTQYHLGKDVVDMLNDADWMADQYSTRSAHEISEQLKCNITTVFNYLDMHGIRPTGSKGSDWQRAMASHFDGAVLEAAIFDNKYKKVDILLPDHKLAIECNGVYWHSEMYKTPNHHKLRKDEVNQLGFRLMQFNDLDWYNKQPVILSMINNAIGARHDKIYARQCSVVDVDAPTAKTFIDNNHLMDANVGAIRKGLVYNGSLVAVMTFGKPNYNRKYTWELLRFCSRIGASIIGGASKLLSHFTSESVGSIISYSDNMISDGNVYQRLGFAKSHDVPPVYSYFKPGVPRLLHRSAARRSNLPQLLGDSFEERLTEKDNMFKAGWLRYYDAGKVAWVIKR